MGDILLASFGRWEPRRQRGPGEPEVFPRTGACQELSCPRTQLADNGVLWASWNSLPGQVAPAAGLEADDDVSDLQVPFLFQVGQNASPEEDFALTNAVQVAVELQGFDLDRGEQVDEGRAGEVAVGITRESLARESSI